MEIGWGEKGWRGNRICVTSYLCTQKTFHTAKKKVAHLALVEGWQRKVTWGKITIYTISSCFTLKSECDWFFLGTLQKKKTYFTDGTFWDARSRLDFISCVACVCMCVMLLLYSINHPHSLTRPRSNLLFFSSAQNSFSPENPEFLFPPTQEILFFVSNLFSLEQKRWL